MVATTRGPGRLNNRRLGGLLARGPRLLLLALFALVGLVTPGAAVDGTATPAPSVSPCTDAGACTEWVTLGSGGARALLYRTFPLTMRNTGVRGALIMVHGIERNADHYFATATSAAFLASALDDTVVIAPAFHSSGGRCKDELQPAEINWTCNNWASGGAATSDPGVTSYDFLDEILKKLSDKSVFPNLTHIVVAGHSGGGRFVSRYEMANQVHDMLGTTISYVSANPSSYAWPDVTRILPVDDGAPDSAATAWKTTKPHTRFSYGPFDANVAPKYNEWPYGFANREGYAARIGDEQLKKQLVSRPITFLLGQVDTLPLGGFDASPPAMAQGATRRVRGEAYVKFVDEHLGGAAKIMIVPECGHNDRCMFTTDSVLPVIFPGR